MSWRTLLLSFSLLLPALSATAQVAASGDRPAPAENPRLVEVGAWLSGLHDVDFINGSFKAEVYLWWISDDPDFRPFETLQVLNGRDWTSRAVSSQVLDDGRYYTAGFLSATVSHHWDLLYYPFDRQVLDIVIETPYTAQQLRFSPQTERSVVGELVELDGFQVAELAISERVASYSTDFGLDSEAATHFSRLVIDIVLERESGRIVVALLVGFIVANIFALLSFAIDISQLGVRTSMLGSAVFAAIGNMYLLNSQMHPAVGSMIIDRFAIITFSVILIALLCGIVVDALRRNHLNVLARRLNRLTFVALLLAAGTLYTVTLQTALRGT